MHILRKSSEAEMIAEYLSAEYRSERFHDNIRDSIDRLGLSNTLITSADISNKDENDARKKLLSDFRGYGVNQELFERFPDITEWSLCAFYTDDLPNIRYIKYSYWNELSSGTHLPIDAAKTIREGRRIYDLPNDGFIKAAEYIKSGGSFPRPFFITSDYEHFVIVEGHLRMTAYALASECFDGIECIVGKCAEEQIERWM